MSTTLCVSGPPTAHSTSILGTVQTYSRTYSCQVPEDRNVTFEGEMTRAAGGGASTSLPAVNPANRAIMRITAMAPDMETKLMGFMRWAGPIMLSALGMSPSKCRERGALRRR